MFGAYVAVLDFSGHHEDQIGCPLQPWCLKVCVVRAGKAELEYKLSCNAYEDVHRHLSGVL
jgi:hypothetical protein